MTLDRRKVLIYLRPDISASERFADAKIEAHHRGDRGDMSRTALLAGLALVKLIAGCRQCWRRCWRKIRRRRRCVECWPRFLRFSQRLPLRHPRQRLRRLRRPSRQPR